MKPRRPWRRNPLLARPPHALHRVRDPKRMARIRELAGDDPDVGVNTTSTFNIAAAYAMSAWTQNSKHGYPVVLTLDVTGLEPLPDVDALLQAVETIYSSGFRSAAREGDVVALAETYSEREHEPVHPGLNPAYFVFDQYQGSVNPFQAIIDVFGEDEEAEEVLENFAAGGELPDEVLIHVVDQRRYLHDFDESRIYEVTAFQPWWRDIVEAYWDEPTREQERAEEAGYHVITTEDILESYGDFNPGEIKVVYKRPGPPPDESQYHGTVSFLAAAALPELDLPDPEGDIWGIDKDL